MTSMGLKLYNSLGKTIQPFESLKKGEVSMYICGITPYDTTHLGHAFTYISFDVLVRYLTHLGNNVKYVQNATDIDDDIIRKANESGRNWKELGSYWTDRFLNDMKSLNWVAPDPYVKATDSIEEIIEIVSVLVKKGFAYQAGGNVYFEVEKFPSYGNLSQYHKDEMIRLSKERGADPDDPNKRNPLDFIVWQKVQGRAKSFTPEVKATPTSGVGPTGETEEGEPFWESPWGEGRPGWHIECSAMIYQYLGQQIDIHGGGDDLIYPHHESEIAQSESFSNNSPFVKFWMHTGSVYYLGEKMSKSLGNLVMVSDLLKKYSANAIRLLLLSHQWKIPWEFKMAEMDKAQKRTEVLENLAKESHEGELDPEFISAMDDNLNTPKALTILETKKPSNLKAHLELFGFKV